MAGEDLVEGQSKSWWKSKNRNGDETRLDVAGRGQGVFLKHREIKLTSAQKIYVFFKE